MEEIDEATSFDDLPKEAQRVRTVAWRSWCGVPVSVVGVGPAREQSLAGAA